MKTVILSCLIAALLDMVTQGCSPYGSWTKLPLSESPEERSFSKNWRSTLSQSATRLLNCCTIPLKLVIKYTFFTCGSCLESDFNTPHTQKCPNKRYWIKYGLTYSCLKVKIGPEPWDKLSGFKSITLASGRRERLRMRMYLSKIIISLNIKTKLLFLKNQIN